MTTEQIQTIEELLAMHPTFELTEDLRSDIQATWQDFDFSLIQNLVFWGIWSGYEEYAELCVFIGVDGSLYMVEAGYSVMDEHRNDVRPIVYQEASPQEALEEINSIIELNDDMNRSF